MNTSDVPVAIHMNDSVVDSIETLTWKEYWESDYEASLYSRFHDRLLHLQQLRIDIFRDKNHSDGLQRISAYAQAYFSLLHRMIDLTRSALDARPLIHKLLALDVMNVRYSSQSALAVIFTRRHPAYLLSRIKYPHMPEDPKYVPLIVGPCLEPGVKKAALFYHYRQMKLPACDDSLLCYLPVEATKRTVGFKCYHSLNSAIREKANPRVVFRAGYIAELAVNPFLNTLRKNVYASSPEIKLADLGSGSGNLMRKLCVSSATGTEKASPLRKFSVTLVDVEHHKPHRHIQDKMFLRCSRHFRCLSTDFRLWIDEQHEKGQREYDVVLMCRLLNNMSRFEVEWIDDWYQVSRFSRKRISYLEWKENQFLPHHALKLKLPQKDRLWITNARFPLIHGHSYSSASLSDYYQGIWLLDKEAPITIGDNSIYYFARRFDNSVLVAPDGESLVGKLCRIGKLIVIEDIDLTASVLRKHLKKFALDYLAASGLTDRKKMHVSQFLCVCDRKYSYALPGRHFF